MEHLVLILNLVSTLFMVGLIWFVQVVHYPLFGRVGTDGFPKYQSEHQRLTTFVVAPPMLIEAFTTILLAWFIPKDVSVFPIVAGIVLLFVVWISTAALQVPCHGKLLDQFDDKVHKRLVRTNWIRTIAWSGRGILVLWMVFVGLN